MDLTYVHLVLNGYNYYLRIGEPLQLPVGSLRMVKALKIQEDRLHIETHPPVTWSLSYPVDSIASMR